MAIGQSLNSSHVICSTRLLGFYVQDFSSAYALKQASEMLQDPLKSNKNKKEEAASSAALKYVNIQQKKSLSNY